MSAIKLKPILTTTLHLLDAVQTEANTREFIHEVLEMYEECLDVALSNHLNMISGLMYEYSRLRGEDRCVDYNLGIEPLSRQDANQLLGNFIEIVKTAVSQALNEPDYRFPAIDIGIRAQTYSSVFLPQNIELPLRPLSKPLPTKNDETK